jgi:site-specific recombinase XerD
MNTSAAIAHFVKTVRSDQRLSKHTTAAITCDLSVFAKSSGFTNDIASLSVVSLAEHLDYLRISRGLQLSSLRRHAATLRRFVAFCVDRFGGKAELLSWKPQLPKPKRLPRPVARTDIRKLLGSDGSESKTRSTTLIAVSLMTATGLRIGEVCAINRGDIERDAKLITVLGKGAKERIVYISNSSLRQQLRSLCAGKDNTAPIFLNRNGDRLTTSSLRRRIETLTRSKGIRAKITPHMFRHTAATWHLQAGLDIRLVQRLLGHSSISTTEIYTQVSDRHLERAVNRADVLRQLGGKYGT